MPGGSSILGHAALSGLLHQVDATAAVQDAIVIGEWKAYRSAIPKNELLRFKAVSDDFYLALGRVVPRTPLVRLFGGPGRYGEDLRRYAAQNGVLLIDPDRWPVTVLTANLTMWSRAGMTPPSLSERRLLAGLFRPMQKVMQPLRDGSFRVLPAHSRSQLDSALMCQDHWSERLWEAIDERPGSFEALSNRGMFLHGEAA
jgi:hypothetical protein